MEWTNAIITGIAMICTALVSGFVAFRLARPKQAGDTAAVLKGLLHDVSEFGLKKAEAEQKIRDQDFMIRAQAREIAQQEKQIHDIVTDAAKYEFWKDEIQPMFKQIIEKRIV